jgi:hypothetical protein
MPWRGPETEGEFPTLGYVVADWIESNCVIPDGMRQGEPLTLTDEQYRFLLFHYRLKPTAVFNPSAPSACWEYTRSALIRPQKWGKSPFAAAIICAEAVGPTVFAGWDSEGEPTGRVHPSPIIQLIAASHAQTENIMGALRPMISLGPLADKFGEPGQMIIRTLSGGTIERVSLSNKSRLGARVSFVIFDESHLLTDTNAGIETVESVRRGAAGMGGRTIETTNTFDPGEESVAKRTVESTSPRVFVDYVAPSPDFDSKDPDELRAALTYVYGDSASDKGGWVDLDRIADEHEMMAVDDRPTADRFFCNVITKAAAAAFDPIRYAELAKPDYIVPNKARIALGFDGARFFDTSALVGTELTTGHQWLIAEWSRPANIGPDDDWEIDGTEVDQVIRDTFDTYNVRRLYADPPHWETNIDAWAGKYGTRKVHTWWTHRQKPMAYAIRAFTTAMHEDGRMTHDGNPVLVSHVGNACRKQLNIRDDEGKFLYVLRKEDAHSKRKIDAAMAAVLSWEAAGDAIASGAIKQRDRPRVYAF